MVTRRKPFLFLVNELTFDDRQRLRNMLSEIDASLWRTSTPMSGPVEVIVEVIEADLDRVEKFFQQLGIPIVGVQEIETEE